MARGRKPKRIPLKAETRIDAAALPLGEPDIAAPATVAPTPPPAVQEHHEFSPSAFPKWAECAHFEGSREAGEEAARGTLLHRAYAMAVAREGGVVGEGLEPDDRAAVEWAVGETRRLFGGPPEAVERKLTYYGEEGELYFGTADATSGAQLADLKTGMARDYGQQMAGYALALMDLKWMDRATTHLLFCDEREVVSREWSAEQAISTVMPIIAARKAAKAGDGPGPRACEYCGWCGRRDTCAAYTAKLVPAGTAMATPEAFEFSAVLADPERLGRFLTACKLVRTDYEERAQTRAKDIIGAGGRVPGWTIQQRKGRESLAAGVLEGIVHRLGHRVLIECGSLSIPKLKKYPDVELAQSDIVAAEPTEALVEAKE